MLNRLKLMTLPEREDFFRCGGASLRLISALHLRFLRYPPAAHVAFGGLAGARP